MTQLPPVAANTAETGDDEGSIVEVVEVDIDEISVEQEPAPVGSVGPVQPEPVPVRLGSTGPAGGQAGTPGYSGTN
jgi:hypothetical protein